MAGVASSIQHTLQRLNRRTDALILRAENGIRDAYDRLDRTVHGLSSHIIYTNNNIVHTSVNAQEKCNETESELQRCDATLASSLQDAIIHAK